MVESQGQRSARHQIERGQVSGWQGGRNQGSQVTEMDEVTCDSFQGMGCARSAATPGPGAEKEPRSLVQQMIMDAHSVPHLRNGDNHTAISCLQGAHKVTVSSFVSSYAQKTSGV